MSSSSIQISALSSHLSTGDEDPILQQSTRASISQPEEEKDAEAEEESKKAISEGGGGSGSTDTVNRFDDPVARPPLVSIPTPQRRRFQTPQKVNTMALQQRRRCEADTGSTPTGRSSSGSEASDGEPSESEHDTSTASVTVPLDCGSSDPNHVEDNSWLIWRYVEALPTPNDQAAFLQENWPELYSQWHDLYMHSQSAPKPGESSLQRCNTFLGRIEQNEMSNLVEITVPDGMTAERKVKFYWENKPMELVIPEGYEAGSQLKVSIPKRPPLEKNRLVAQVRDHTDHTLFPDTWSLWNFLRHPPRDDYIGPRSSGEDAFKSDEMKGRLLQYKNMGGKSMAPLLPFTPEEESVTE
jgi:hypothetical protein